MLKTNRWIKDNRLTSPKHFMLLHKQFYSILLHKQDVRAPQMTYVFCSILLHK